jgi:nucleoside phosphorylase
MIRDGAPASKNRRLGSWFATRIGGLRVLCFKSELHLNQDGKPLDEAGHPAEGKTGFATLPVKDLFHQIMDEVEPSLVITTGTSGATYLDHDLGDVVVTRGAKFRLSDEFKNEPFNAIDNPGAQYRSEWEVPTSQFEPAIELMRSFQHRLVEPVFAPPTKRYPFAGAPIHARANKPGIKLDDGQMMPAFHPILTTDFFEFGTSGNKLELQGCAVEMGDAVLGLACEERNDPPNWLVVRNLSDPQINADLPTKPRSLDMQAHWAVWYYEKYGYWTSVNGALACWAVIAGLEG